MEKKEQKGNYRDSKAPGALTVIVVDNEGHEWGRLYATPKDFSTGSVGFYTSSKLVNPANPEAKYQAGLTFTLAHSKPE
jgi:hypothetical protein